MTILEIPANEPPTIRVFAINRPPQDIATSLKTRPKPDLARSLLGAPHIDAQSVEIFAVSDLAGVGLPSYLSDGYAVSEGALSGDHEKLSKLDGYVMLVFSDSFAGAQTALRPGADLTFIGSYPEARANMTSRPIATASAHPYSGVPRSTPTQTPRGPAGSALIAVAILTAIGILIWWIV